MRKLILVVHTSLDGFVADLNAELNGFDASEENLQFVCNLTKEADAALFGRVSYRLLNSYWPTVKDSPKATKAEIAFSNWYNSAEKIVVSKTLEGNEIPKTIIISNDIATSAARLKEQDGKDILVFGSPSIAQILIQHNLIDSYWVFINPAIFGNGIPLFVPTSNFRKLKLSTTKQFSNGEIALNYLVEQ